MNERETGMRLYKVTLTHYGEKSSGRGTHGFVLAPDSLAVARMFLDYDERDGEDAAGRLDDVAASQNTADAACRVAKAMNNPHHGIGESNTCNC